MKFNLNHRALCSLIFALPPTALYAETKTPSTLNAATTLTMAQACLQAASEAGHTVAIAIFNSHGTLLHFNYGNAAPAAGEVAQWKGLSAAMYQVSTVETAKWNIPTAPKIATAQGGVAVLSKNDIALGGIGVSGAPPQFDEDCASLAAKAVGLKTR